METLITLDGVSKGFGAKTVLKDLSLDITRGQIIGLVGVNGAGKTTLLNAILGLIGCQGRIQVLGQDPMQHRARLLKRVSYISDVACLPRWLRVDQLLAYTSAVHPHFNRQACQAILANTQIPPKAPIKRLSKGMVTQLHLALVMAMDSDILILDEPTLGLDVVYRQGFYQRLLEDYFDHQRTIIVTTHQVEEIEHLLTHVLFLHDGRFVLNCAVDKIQQRFSQLQVGPNELEAARALGPLSERATLAGHLLTFEKPPQDLARLGQPSTPTLADIFVAKVGRAA